MGKRYLIDTNVVIYYLDKTLPESSSHLIDVYGSNLSVITRMELLAWKNATENYLKVLNSFIKGSLVYNLDENIIIKAIEIRKITGIKLPDAIIAATAITHNLVLLTRNSADFKSIKDLQLLNPWEK